MRSRRITLLSESSFTGSVSRVLSAPRDLVALSALISLTLSVLVASRVLMFLVQASERRAAFPSSRLRLHCVSDECESQALLQRKHDFSST